MSLVDNKRNAVAFYETAYLGNPREAVELYVGENYLQHNPKVEDGKAGFIAYFEEMKQYCPNKEIEFVRVIGEGDLVALHTHQTWGAPENKEYVTMDFFRFEDGKIVEHWDSIQEVMPTKSGRAMY
ncbi:nuclear transport factor 2 family protein [Streptococcus ovuberis]|uniref:SnoaL-like domain-containing protein n=1 Tax=Streptococcus ovuberis TaxID=1936207 RepID=A0A7X6S238_9STRE|nr:ester cyclase [Streptococcus ovuberis]NKZ20836.1 SnoaL-like domain-containing protein [Streptococcus ovuberis]